MVLSVGAALRPRSSQASFRERLWVSRCASSLAATAADIQALCVSAGDSLREMQKKNYQLRSVLKTIRWPRLRRFEAKGKLYDLPLRSDRQGSSTATLCTTRSEATLQYLAGFFDGDGCVSCDTNASACRLTVEQVFDGAEVLMQFRETFGGSVVRGCGGFGLVRPVLRWSVSGKLACQAAALLAPSSISKNQQLRMAATWPDEKPSRHKCQERLRLLKQSDSAVAGHCTLEYLAGFFDAEGCIGLQHGSPKLAVGQKFVTVLVCLQRCLLQNLSTPARIYHGKKFFSLHILGTAACKKTLGAMLKAGLLRKANQARLVLGLTQQNASEASDALAELTGNQQLGKRLDQAGVLRAREISAVQQRVRVLERRGHLREAEAVLQQLGELKRQHSLLNAQRENGELLHYAILIQDLEGELWWKDKWTWRTVYSGKMNLQKASERS